MGETVLLFNEASEMIESLTLPKAIGSYCIASEPVTFLQDSSSTCKMPYDKALSEMSAILEKFNLTKALIFPVAPSMEYHCGSGCLNITVNLTTDTFEEGGVLYVIWHNYSHIQGFEIFVENPQMKQEEVSVKFAVSFRATESKDLHQYLVSGNPGYLVGKPILTAKSVTFSNYTEDEDKKLYVLDFFYFKNASEPYTANRTLTLAGSSRGRCKQLPMEFGVNQHQKCHLALHSSDGAASNLTELCRQHQRSIFEVLIPHFLNSTDLMAAIYVSEAGNPQNDSRNWLKMSPPSVEPAVVGRNESFGYVCSNMVITVSYEFRFARLLVANLVDQRIIRDASVTFGQKVDLKFSNDDDSVVPLYSQVQFLDFTASFGCEIKVFWILVLSFAVVNLLV